MRHNIINLVKVKDLLSNNASSLLGIAPSYVNPDTGQIIGTTANIFVHTQENSSNLEVRKYIRYEIFQKDKKTDKENEIHIVSPYLRAFIKKECPDVESFISEKKREHLKPSDILNDRKLIISCGRQITKRTLLHTILHEMGHNFGLAHNFKASADHVNYYQSVDEIQAIFPNINMDSKEIAQSSSVMDYLRDDKTMMNFLGKYDLAALRYLYFDEIELKDGGFASLNTNSDLKQQKPLNEKILEKRKNYFHCSHDVIKSATGKNKLTEPIASMCEPFDHGRNPGEIVQDRILVFKRGLNRFRYRYDSDPESFIGSLESYSLSGILDSLISQIFTPLESYYDKWLTVRDNYLKKKGADLVYILNDQESIEKYKTLVAEGKKDNEKYALYYPVREQMLEFMMELANLDDMKCRFKGLRRKRV